MPGIEISGPGAKLSVLIVCVPVIMLWTPVATGLVPGATVRVW